MLLYEEPIGCGIVFVKGEICVFVLLYWEQIGCGNAALKKAKYVGVVL